MKIDIPSFEQVRVLVVGDVMLDRYWHGDALRMSPEAPVPVVHINELEERPGGAGNVALNLAALGCQVTLLSIVGNDAQAHTLESQLQQAGVNTVFHYLDGVPTITKLRVIGRNQQLIRLDFEPALDAVKAYNLLPLFRQQITGADILILSDYAKGALHDAQAIIYTAKQAGVPVLIDPKTRDFSLYRGATIVTPNQKEFEAVVGSCATQEELIAKGHGLMRDCDLSALLVTQGEHGMTLLQEGVAPQHLPTRAREVYDVTGAGDTVIAVLAAALAAGETMHQSASLANTAAGIVIRKLGAATVSVPELRRALQRQQGSEFGLLTEEELMVVVEDARAHQEKIVMTNGCFDILHAGHIQYLEQARELGQRLIIAVNDDDSVRRLKGSKRPINSLKERMTVLSALRAVDWVVPFSEDTPERLIKCVTPDVLVKGGDYAPHEVAGGQHVIAHGGVVQILPFRQGCSTSAIIDRVKSEV